MTKILIIDDGTTNLRSISTTLRRAGIEVEELACSVSGLLVAEANPPDLIVTVEAPSGLDAVELLELKREEPSLNDTAVLVIGNSNKRKLEYFRLGCDDFVALPVDETELFFRVCAILRRAGQKGVRGSLHDISIIDLIQMLVAARRSGVLEVETEALRGMLYLREGQVIHAQIDNGTQGSSRKGAKQQPASGEEVFLQILRNAVKGGEFSFNVDDVAEVTHSIQKRTDHLLLGLASMLDEEGSS